jgi:methyl-accepting chemotaxis protein
MIIEQVQQLAAQLKSASDQITQLVTALSGQVQQTTWWGADHDRFVNDFNAQVPTLHGVAQQLQEFANRANLNAHEQAQTSANG